jgi:hypothetical protein
VGIVVICLSCIFTDLWEGEVDAKGEVLVSEV